MDQQLLVENIVRLAKIAKLHDLPVVLSTVNVRTGAILAGVPPSMHVRSRSILRAPPQAL
jgi:hypothetical protein